MDAHQLVNIILFHFPKLYGNWNFVYGIFHLFFLNTKKNGMNFFAEKFKNEIIINQRNHY